MCPVGGWFRLRLAGAHPAAICYVEWMFSGCLDDSAADLQFPYLRHQLEHRVHPAGPHRRVGGLFRPAENQIADAERLDGLASIGCEEWRAGDKARRLQYRSRAGTTNWGGPPRPVPRSLPPNFRHRAMGRAAFGKTRVGERRSPPKPQRGQGKTPRRSYSIYDTNPADQVSIPSYGVD